MNIDEIEERYINGEYLKHNPTWDIEHAPRKARELFHVIPNEYLRDMFSKDLNYVVEVGCGAGGVLYYFSELLKKRNIDHKSVGYDLSPIAIEMARKNFGRSVEFHCSKEIRIERKAAVILLADIIEHIAMPDEFIDTLKSSTDYFLIRLPLDRSLWNLALRKLPKLTEELGHIHFFTYRDALLFFRRQGLNIIKYELTRNFMDGTNLKSAVSKLMFPVRYVTSLISPKINSLLWGGNSIVIFAYVRRGCDMTARRSELCD